MGFFKRHRGESTREAAKRVDAEAKWAELEAEVKRSETGETAEPASSDHTQSDSAAPDAGQIAGRPLIADDLQRYAEMDLSTELGDAPAEDATPGRIDVDIDALLSDTPAPVVAEAGDGKAEVASEPAAEPEAPSAPDPVLSMPAPAIRSTRADVGTMRLDVARIAADIQSGEELYRRAQKRIENLTGFVERAELDFSLLNRLEPENRRLKARNRTLEAEIDDARRKLDVMRADLEDHQKRLAERSAVLEQLHSRMSVAQKNLQEYERVLGQTRTNSDKHALAAERAQTSLDVERRENQVLREKITELTAETDARHTAAVEAQKMTDSMRQDALDFRAQAESLSSENVELRNALDHAKRANNQMRGEMVSLHEDIRNFKTTSEFTVIAREDEMTAMRQQLDELRKQLEIKDEIVRNAARDVQELRKLRTAQDLERERLEAIVETQTFQLEDAGARLIEAQQNVTNFDRRYRDVAAALNQQQALRESNAPAAHPDIAPALAEPLADPRIDALADDDIESRITDFALGLRSDIA